MKKKIILTLIITAIILMFGRINTLEASSIADIINSGMAGVATGAGSAAASGHKHSFNKYTTAATCTTTGEEVWKCSCGQVASGSVLPALGHIYGKWYSISDSQHKRNCTRSGCSASQTNSHYGGSWYDADGGQGPGSHYKDCDGCGHKKYTSEPHNKDKKVAQEGNSIQHKTYCSSCGGEHYMGMENHSGWATGPDDSHICADNCGYNRATNGDIYPYHCYPLANGGTYEAETYECLCPGCTDGTLSFTDNIIVGRNKGLYTAIGSSQTWVEPPRIGGTYTITFNHKIRDINGTDLEIKMREDYFTLHGWQRGTIEAHHNLGLPTAEAVAQYELKKMNIVTSEDFAPGYIYMDIELETNENAVKELAGELSAEYCIDYATKYYVGWKEKNFYEKGNAIIPTQEHTAGSKTLLMTYQVSGGRWYMQNPWLFVGFSENVALYTLSKDDVRWRRWW